MKQYQALVNSGDHAALKRVMKKAEAGEALCVAFLGGSITEGYSSTDPKLCYSARVCDWWRENFPKSELHYVNAGIGGTGSQYGAARVEKDVLRFRPDVVFVDFSVNDEANEFSQECYEGLIRRLLRSESRPAVVLLHFVQYDSGISAEEQHRRIGEHYGLPCISTRSSLYAKLRDGVLEASLITQDMLHPNDEGHAMIAAMITDLLDTVKEEPAGTGEERKLPEALTANAYENAVRLQHADAEAELAGFEKDTKEPEYPADHFRGGWTGSRAGDELRLRFRGSELALQFRRTVKRPALLAEAVVDGDREHAVILDADFDQDWGDCLSIVTIMRHGRMPEGCREEKKSPVNYGKRTAALEGLRDVSPSAEEHELCLHILGDPDSLGWEQAAMQTGGPAWIKTEGNDSPAGFDLLGIIVSSPDGEEEK
ncbi:MAG: SGNH/GDSL hydrolase family protein [Lachnospiraceae bacterium]|nr:SGNH/GDSL hydrolase family protein [Lachnospiraceae bacterium]